MDMTNKFSEVVNGYKQLIYHKLLLVRLAFEYVWHFEILKIGTRKVFNINTDKCSKLVGNTSIMLIMHIPCRIVDRGEVASIYGGFVLESPMLDSK